jgi:hypothetical protein
MRCPKALEVSCAAFVAPVASAPTRQAVAFSDQTCGTAHPDEISMTGAMAERPLVRAGSACAAALTRG